MSFDTLAARARPKREKLFGMGRSRPIDREAKVRIMHVARALMRRTEPGKAYGAIKAKAYAVLEALLWGFHNARSGHCFPSLERIAERAGCARSTAAEAIKALEASGVLTWVNRLARIRVRCRDLLGEEGSRVRVIRTSNAYTFADPKRADDRGFSSKSDFPSGTKNQEFSLLLAPPSAPSAALDGPLAASLARLGRAVSIAAGSR